MHPYNSSPSNLVLAFDIKSTMSTPCSLSTMKAVWNLDSDSCIKITSQQGCRPKRKNGLFSKKMLSINSPSLKTSKEMVGMFNRLPLTRLKLKVIHSCSSNSFSIETLTFSRILPKWLRPFLPMTPQKSVSWLGPTFESSLTNSWSLVALSLSRSS